MAGTDAMPCGHTYDQWAATVENALKASLAAARAEGAAEQRRAWEEALRDRERWLAWWKTHPLVSFDEHLNGRAADYLSSLPLVGSTEGTDKT